MSFDDPLGVTRPFVPRKQEPDFRREFWAETPDLRPNRGRDRLATSYVCRYVNGRHEHPVKPWCPHYEYEDETGKRINPAWTVQWDLVGDGSGYQG